MRLLEFIKENIEPILDEWEAFAAEIQAAEGMGSEALRDHAKAMLETIVEDLESPETAEEKKDKSRGRGRSQGHPRQSDSASERHAVARAKEGFTVVDVVAEFRALRASVLRLWDKDSDAADKSDLNDVTRFNEAIDQAVAESVARYSSLVMQDQNLFLGILGHDLRNPLGAIVTSAQLLLRDNALDARHIKAASIIYSSGEQMTHLIDDLLNFTRTRLGQGIPIATAPANLADIAEQSVTQARAFHPERTISFEAVGDLNGQWDAARIGQVFSNLIDNAVKHGSTSEAVRVALSTDGAGMVATVHNRGKPIPESDIPHIFEPLRRSSGASTGQRQDSSLGLGLYITREIVQAHEGTVTVVSTADEGTTFTVRLPRKSKTS